MLDESMDEGIEIVELKKRRYDLTLEDVPPEIFPTVFQVAQEHYNKQIKAESKLNATSLFYVDPTAKSTGFWDFWIIFVVYFLQFQISLTLAFGPQFWAEEVQNNALYFAIYISLLVFFCAEIVVCFHKGYYAFGRGRVIDDHDLIVKHYFKIQFIIDIVSLLILLIPLIKSDYILNFLQLIPACLLFFKKARCQDEIVSMLQYRRNLRVTFIIFILCCDVLLIGNFGACIFVGLDLLLWRQQYYGNNPQYYWLSNDSSYSVNLIDGPWILQYVMAQSFSSGTLSTLAPGPFAKNPIEILYAIVLMTFFMLLASYVGEVLISLLYQEKQIRIFHENNIQKFDKFMKVKDVAPHIKERVFHFFELIWEVEVKMSVERQKEILQKMPQNLRNQLVVEMGFAKNIHFLNYFSTKDGKFIQRISNKITTMIVDSDTLLFECEKFILPENRSLYYLKDGLAKFYLNVNNQEEILALSNVEKFIGSYQFITGMAFHFNCRSVDLCSVQQLFFNDFMEILQLSDFKEQFYQLKFNVLIEEELGQIGKLCVICGQNHTENNCEQIDIGMQIKNYLKSKGGAISQNRKPYTRRTLNQKKVHRKDPTVNFQGKKLLPFIFAKFGGLGQMLRKITHIEQQLEQVQNYKRYFSNYNVTK